MTDKNVQKLMAQATHDSEREYHMDRSRALTVMYTCANLA